MTHRIFIFCLVIMATALGLLRAHAQVLVYPQRANQSAVNYYDLEWKDIDITVGPKPGEDGEARLAERPGKIRFFFYESSRQVAELAVPSITESYRYLVDQFNYVPEERFPYFLYNHYLQFVETNLFPVQIGTLGVTSPTELTMAVPYFGDHQKFHRVSTHELIHQFMSQKLRAIHQRPVRVETFRALPLWFVEGMAEYYTWRGLDAESKMLVADMINHPEPERGFYFKSFFQNYPASFFGVYKFGQARVAFLEEAYGRGTVQKVLEHSRRLSEWSFEQLVENVTGDKADKITAKFSKWVKGFSYSHYLAARQHEADLDLVSSLEGELLSLTASPDGEVLVYKHVDIHTGETALSLMHGKSPYFTEVVAEDQRPGLVSLHPEQDQSFVLSRNKLAYFGVAEGQDILFIQNYELDKEDGEFDLGEKIELHLRDKGVFSAQSPAFSPDGESLVFVGFDKQGRRDLFLVTPKEDDFLLKRLTNNPYAEREVTWGEPEKLFFTSDATEGGHFNIFQMDPRDSTSEPEQVTFVKDDLLSPLATNDGRLFFVRFEDGMANIFEHLNGSYIRRTYVDTGALSVSHGREHGLWALFQKGGRRWPAFISQEVLLDEVATDFEKAEGEPFYPLPEADLSQATSYEPFALKNWEFGRTFALLGGGFGGIAGQLVTSAHDQLRNHSVNLNLYINGSLEYSEGQLFYTNNEGRWVWGTGFFQSVGVRSERLPDETRFSSVERFSGVSGILRYPFSRYFYAQGQLSLGALDRGLTDGTEGFLRENYSAELSDWKADNAGTDFQTELGMSLGYNSLQYHRYTGPYAGSSVLLQGIVDHIPGEKASRSRLRLDGEKFIPLADWTNLFFRAGVGSTFSGAQISARDFYMASTYTLRPVPRGQERFLLGDRFVFSTMELQFPLTTIIQIPLFNMEGVAGVDFGGAGDTWNELWDYRVLGGVTGVNFTVRPLVFRLHFAKPIPIGAEALPNRGNWVTHFALTYMYD